MTYASNLFKIFNSILLLCLFLPFSLTAEVEFISRGEIISWADGKDGNQQEKEMGLRYLPMFKLFYAISESLNLDAEATANLYGNWNVIDDRDAQTSHDEKAYRLWTRLYTDQLEARLGLQEVSFGPGKILRSLRWFDQKNIRDPTGFTDGVKGLLIRYYFEDNTNGWGWVLNGNNNSMGISPLKTGKDEIEVGGRLQVPFGSTDLGVSVHQRKVDLREFIHLNNPEEKKLREQRIGIDMFWNLGAGVYFESTYLQLEKNAYLPEEQIFLTLGCDYTFDYGDGISSIVEIMGIDLDFDEEDVHDTTLWLFSLSEQMALNLLDQVQLFVFFNFKNETSSFNGTWKRSYDDFIFNVTLYYSDTPSTTSSSGDQLSSFPELSGGKGIRLLAQYNY